MSSCEAKILTIGPIYNPNLRSYLNQIHFVKCLVITGLLDVEDRDDVLMVEVSKKLHLSEGSQTEHGVIERGNLLDSDLLA